MLLYCLKYRKNTEIKKPIVKTKWAVCDSKKSKFLK